MGLMERVGMGLNMNFIYISLHSYCCVLNPILFNLQYIVTNSVEERMLTLQDQKRKLMSQAFGLKTQSIADRRRSRIREMKHLIGL